jgi:ABC-2 type transport system permease protein
VVVKRLAPGEPIDARKALAADKRSLAAIVSGTPAAPVLTGPGERVSQWQGPVSLVAARALSREAVHYPEAALAVTASSHADTRRGQMLTAQAGQTLLFLLMMLLAGMVLSNLVEEKGNKIIEILAAAVPMDAVFLGKLFAMLAISMVGVAVWTAAGVVIVAMMGHGAPVLPEPAVGWPMFLGLGVIYFAMGYLLIGSVFLAVGSMAPTVRDVQSLSMPASMIQLLLFLFASYAVTKPGSWMEMAAILVPFSSPFAMLARAAQDQALWPHLLAIGWQALCVAVFVRTGAQLFRTWVMKSGTGGGSGRKRGLFARLRPARA